MAKKSSSGKPKQKAAKKRAASLASLHTNLAVILRQLERIEFTLQEASEQRADAKSSRAMKARAQAQVGVAKVKSAQDVQKIVIRVLEHGTGIRGVTRETEFAADLGLTSPATKALYIDIRDVIIAGDQQIQNFTSNDFAANKTVGKAVDALVAAIPGLDD